MNNFYFVRGKSFQLGILAGIIFLIAGCNENDKTPSGTATVGNSDPKAARQAQLDKYAADRNAATDAYNLEALKQNSQTAQAAALNASNERTAAAHDASAERQEVTKQDGAVNAAKAAKGSFLENIAPSAVDGVTRIMTAPKPNKDEFTGQKFSGFSEAQQACARFRPPLVFNGSADNPGCVDPKAGTNSDKTAADDLLTKRLPSDSAVSLYGDDSMSTAQQIVSSEVKSGKLSDPAFLVTERVQTGYDEKNHPVYQNQSVFNSAKMQADEKVAIKSADLNKTTAGNLASTDAYLNSVEGKVVASLSKNGAAPDSNVTKAEENQTMVQVVSTLKAKLDTPEAKAALGEDNVQKINDKLDARNETYLNNLRDIGNAPALATGGGDVLPTGPQPAGAPGQQNSGGNNAPGLTAAPSIGPTAFFAPLANGQANFYLTEDKTIIPDASSLTATQRDAIVKQVRDAANSTASQDGDWGATRTELAKTTGLSPEQIDKIASGEDPNKIVPVTAPASDNVADISSIDSTILNSGNVTLNTVSSNGSTNKPTPSISQLSTDLAANAVSSTASKKPSASSAAIAKAGTSSANAAAAAVNASTTAAQSADSAAQVTDYLCGDATAQNNCLYQKNIDTLYSDLQAYANFKSANPKLTLAQLHASSQYKALVADQQGLASIETQFAESGSNPNNQTYNRFDKTLNMFVIEAQNIDNGNVSDITSSSSYSSLIQNQTQKNSATQLLAKAGQTTSDASILARSQTGTLTLASASGGTQQVASSINAADLFDTHTTDFLNAPATRQNIFY